MSDSINDVAALCLECVHCQPDGEHMVGSYLGGGPEQFVCCDMGHDQIKIRYNEVRCEDRE